jgi:MFS family permease
MVPMAILAARLAETRGYWIVFVLALLALPLRGAIAASVTGSLGLVPVQMLDGVGAGLLGVAVPGLVARILSGTGHVNAGLGAVHGFAGPIGGMFSAPHGEICAALLPDVMEMNLRALREREPNSYAIRRYYHVAGLLTENHNATSNTGIEWIRRLVSDFKIPRLGSHGIKPGHIPEIVKNAKNASSMKANPIALTEAELAEILQRAL